MTADALLKNTLPDVRSARGYSEATLAIHREYVREATLNRQKALSEKSGVSLGSVKRFETSGEISLHALIKLAIALDLDDALIHLFEDAPFLSIEEIIHGQD